MSETTNTFCVNHPTVETMLRCHRCNNPICVKCAIKTPTGYQCPQCVKKHQKAFDTSLPIDLPIGFVTAAFLSGIACVLVSFVGFLGFFAWIAVIAGAPTAGVMIAEGCRSVTNRRRSDTLFKVITAGAVCGAIPFLLFNIGNLMGLIFLIVYLVMAIPALYTRLSGIQLFR